MKKLLRNFVSDLFGFQKELDLAKKTIIDLSKNKERPKAIVLVDFENMFKSLESLGAELVSIEKGFQGLSNFVRNITRGEGYDISYFYVFSPDTMSTEAKGWLNHLYSTVNIVDFASMVMPCPSRWTMKGNYVKEVDSVDWKMTFLGMRLIRDLKKIDRIYAVTGDWDFSDLRSDAEMHGVDCRILKVRQDDFAKNYFRAWGGAGDIDHLEEFIPPEEEEVVIESK